MVVMSTFQLEVLMDLHPKEDQSRLLQVLGSNDGGFFNLSGGYANGHALIDNGGSINVRGGGL